MKKAETQEQEFLEVCSSYDHDLLTGKKEMTLKDYERITYLVSSLGYSQYLQFLIGKYMDLAQADEEREEREHEIYLEYPEYYEDETTDAIIKGECERAKAAISIHIDNQEENILKNL